METVRTETVASPGLGKVASRIKSAGRIQLERIYPKRYKVGSRLAITLLSPGSGYAEY